MKKLLLKLAHLILSKYDVIPLDLKDKVLFQGQIFEIQSYVLEKEFYKTDLTLNMCDCIKLIDINNTQYNKLNCKELIDKILKK